MVEPTVMQPKSMNACDSLSAAPLHDPQILNKGMIAPSISQEAISSKHAIGLKGAYETVSALESLPDMVIALDWKCMSWEHGFNDKRTGIGPLLWSSSL